MLSTLSGWNLALSGMFVTLIDLLAEEDGNKMEWQHLSFCVFFRALLHI